MKYMKIKLAVVCLLSAPVFGYSQSTANMKLALPTINSAAYNQSSKNLKLTKSGGAIELPFIDDFSADHFPGSDIEPILWDGRQATRNATWAVNPPTVGVVSFDGADETGFPYDWEINPSAEPADTLTSVAINCEGTPDDGIGLSFYYQSGGLGDLPSASLGDSLILEFYAPELDQWVWMWSVTASEATDFEFVYIPLQSEMFLKNGFRFRFRNYAALQGALDLWHLDYVWLDRNGVNQNPINNDVAFVSTENTLLAEYTAMPLSHFASGANPQQYMRDAITLLLRNLNDGARTLEGNHMRILYDGEVIADFPNPNNPSIGAQQTLEYTHSVSSSPNDFVFPTGLNDTAEVFEVQFYHSVSDFVPTSSNDTIRFFQVFDGYYAYDDGSAELMNVLTNTGTSAAMQFVNQQADSIYGIYMFTMPGNYDYSGANFTIKLWAEGAGAPGTVLASKAVEIEYGVESYQQQILYEFDEPVFLPAGIFYVGYTQTSINNPDGEGVGIGLDMNTSSNADHFYFGDSQGNWGLVPDYPGSLMIRPMFKTKAYGTGISEKDVQQVQVFPNPTSDFFVLRFESARPVWMSLMDLSGKLIRRQQVTSGSRIPVADLEPGLYLLKLQSEEQNFSNVKILIQ